MLVLVYSVLAFFVIVSLVGAIYLNFEDGLESYNNKF
jgi:hypothetical protein